MSVPLAVAGQSLRVYASLGVDLSGATVALKYKSPAGNPGEVVATIDEASTGAVHGDITAATLAAAGDWSFWVVATLSGGEVVKSYGAVVRVLAEGTVVA